MAAKALEKAQAGSTPKADMIKLVLASEYYAAAGKAASRKRIKEGEGGQHTDAYLSDKLQRGPEQETNSRQMGCLSEG